MAVEPDTLVCAPAHAAYMVPGSDFTHNCSTCNQRVMIAPSGQALLRRIPEARILCADCFSSKPPSNIDARFAAEPAQLAREVATSVPNFWRKRN